MSSPIRGLAAAVRSLLRRPRTSLYTLVLLALGIGLSTAMFSVLDGVLLRGLPFPEGERIVRVTTRGPEALDEWLPAVDFAALDEAVKGAAYGEPVKVGGRGTAALEVLAGGLTLNAVVTRPGVGSKGMTGAYVTDDLFPMLGVEPLLGRSFGPRDVAAGAPGVVIVSHHLWKRWFGGDPEALGEKVIFNREPMTVVGVMPPGFQFPVRQEAWTPLRREAWMADYPVFAIGRLAPGVSPREAERALAPVAARLDEEAPLRGSGETRRIAVAEYVETLVPPEIHRALRLMLWAVLGVLLIACGNAAGLRLGDALSREREIAVRRALGAGAGQLLRPLLAEAAVLAAAAAAGGLGLAWLLVRLAGDTILRGSMMERLFWVEVRLDARTCLFAVAAAAVAALLGTLPPALWSLRQRSLSLGSGGSGGRSATGTRTGMRLAGLLVVGQVAVCFALVSGSALLMESGRSLLSRGPGFDPEGLMRVMVNPFQAEWEGPEEPRGFYARLLPRLEEDPAVASVTLASGVPWGGERGVRGVGVRTGEQLGEDPAEAEDLPRARLLRVLPGFFGTLRLPILAGRALEPRDLPGAGSGGPAGSAPREELRALPVVASASFASRHLGAGRGAGSLGEPVELVLAGDRPPIRGRVVGIATDRTVGPPGGSPGPGSAVYAPLDVGQGGAGFLIVRARSADGLRERGAAADDSGAGDLLRRIDRSIAGIDSLVATLDGATYLEDRAETVWAERRLAELSTLFAAASLVLAGFGLFGAAVLSLRRRDRELAVRSALGAVPRQLRALVLRQGLAWIALGLAAGSALAALGHRLLRSFFHDFGAQEPALAVAAAALTVLALAAALLGPALRAGRIEPAVVLEGE